MKSKEFWKDIIYKDGKLNEEQILKELEDYYFLLNEVPIVYNEITGGLLSKPNYSAETILAEFNERFWDKEIVADDIGEMIKTSKTLRELKEELEDYLR